MGEATAIGWCDSTFNIAWGCVKIDPCCDFCYAETFDKRIGGKHWGPGSDRRLFGPDHWFEPLLWNAKAEGLRLAGVLPHRPRVFCSSMADVFEDHPTVAAERPWLGRLIDATPELDWLLLTKRHAMILRGLEQMFPDNERRANVWVGCTAGLQASLDMRWPYLMVIGAVVRFLSVEPMLAPVQLRRGDVPDWVIIGGESGPKARPFHVEYARQLVDQCLALKIPVFVKQLGSKPYRDGRQVLLPKEDRTGAEIATFDALGLSELAVRQFPAPHRALAERPLAPATTA